MSTVPSLVLFEHASGYALFRVKEFEEVSALQAEVEAATSDVSAFNSVVRYALYEIFCGRCSESPYGKSMPLNLFYIIHHL